MITLKKNSGSQSGMKMKATPREARKASQYPNCFIFSPTQTLRWIEKPVQYLNTDFRQTAQQYGPTVLTVDIVTWPEAPVLHSQIEGCWNGFFFNCLNLTFRVAFVFDFYLCWGRACPVTLTRHPSKGVAGRRHRDPCARVTVPALAPPLPAFFSKDGRTCQLTVLHHNPMPSG